MRSLFLTLAALLAVSCLASTASANGGLGISANIHNRAQNRQQQRQFNHHHGQFRQQNFVQPYYYQRAQLVAPLAIYAPPPQIVREVRYVEAQPVVAAYEAAPVCAAPVLGYTQGYSQPIRQRFVKPGCSQFFRQNNFAY